VDLSNSIKTAIAARDYGKVLPYLDSIMTLIPDDNDPRHQKAAIAKNSILMELDLMKRKR